MLLSCCWFLSGKDFKARLWKKAVAREKRGFSFIDLCHPAVEVLLLSGASVSSSVQIRRKDIWNGILKSEDHLVGFGSYISLALQWEMLPNEAGGFHSLKSSGPSGYSRSTEIISSRLPFCSNPKLLCAMTAFLCLTVWLGSLVVLVMAKSQKPSVFVLLPSASIWATRQKLRLVAYRASLKSESAQLKYKSGDVPRVHLGKLAHRGC